MNRYVLVYLFVLALGCSSSTRTITIDPPNGSTRVELRIFDGACPGADDGLACRPSLHSDSVTRGEALTKAVPVIMGRHAVVVVASNEDNIWWSACEEREGPGDIHVDEFLELDGCGPFRRESPEGSCSEVTCEDPRVGDAGLMGDAGVGDDGRSLDAGVVSSDCDCSTEEYMCEEIASDGLCHQTGITFDGDNPFSLRWLDSNGGFVGMEFDVRDILMEPDSHEVPNEAWRCWEGVDCEIGGSTVAVAVIGNSMSDPVSGYYFVDLRDVGSSHFIETLVEHPRLGRFVYAADTGDIVSRIEIR